MKELRDLGNILNSCLRKFGHKLDLSCESLSAVFKSLLCVSLRNELLNIRSLNHKVEFVASSARELNGSWGNVAIEVSPLVADSLESFEHSAVEFDESLLNDRLVLARTSLEVHHGGKGASRSCPVLGVLVSQVVDTGHVAGDTLLDKDSSVETERVTVLGIEVAGECASSLVSEEMALGQEFTRVLFLFLANLELLLDEKDEQLLSVDLGDLHITVRISIEEKLLRDTLRQEVEKCLG